MRTLLEDIEHFGGQWRSAKIVEDLHRIIDGNVLETHNHRGTEPGIIRAQFQAQRKFKGRTSNWNDPVWIGMHLAWSLGVCAMEEDC